MNTSEDISKEDWAAAIAARKKDESPEEVAKRREAFVATLPPVLKAAWEKAIAERTRLR